MDHVTLICPPGAEEGLISHGTTEYRPYLADPRDPQTDRLIDVPPEVAIHFLKQGGFALPKVLVLQSAGNVRLIHRDGGAVSCSWNGQSYPADDKGAVTVPVEAQADLADFGFIPLEAYVAGRPAIEPDAAVPAPAPAPKPKQTVDGGGATKLPADPEGSAHPDGVKPEPEPDPAPKPEPAPAAKPEAAPAAKPEPAPAKPAPAAKPAA